MQGRLLARPPSGALELVLCIVPLLCYPRYYLRAPIIGALASQARHDCCPQSPMIRGVLSPGLVGGW